MRGKLIVGAIAVAATGVMAAGALTGTAAMANPGAWLSGYGSAYGAPKVFGLTDEGNLVTFRADRPGRVRWVGPVTGLTDDTGLVGIDFRVQNGMLYGVGNLGGIYTLDTASAQAAKVSQLTVALDGQNFGVDFNPAANRLRVVSDTGQNLRHNIDDPMGTPAAGTTAVDTPLTTPPATTTTLGVSAAAYTNNDLDPSTAATLFDINTATDQVMVQSPANQGELAATGSLLVDAGDSAGLDIHSKLREGRTTANTAYAALAVDGTRQFYQVSLLTGDATLIGGFPADAQVTDIAAELGN